MSVRRVSLNGQQFTPRAPLVTGLVPPVQFEGNGSSATAVPVQDEAVNTTSRAINFTYFGVFQSADEWSYGPSNGRPWSLPTSGPASGNTSIVVYGNPLDLTGGNHYQCRIGPLLVNATYLPPAPDVQFGAAGILCITEPLIRGVGHKQTRSLASHFSTR